MRLGGSLWHLRSRPMKRVIPLFLLIIFLIICLSYVLFAEDNTDVSPTPTNQNSKVMARVIPRIIHQSYKSNRIPAQYWDSISSWRKNHPEYIYFLWTDEDIERFIQNEYPHYVSLFKGYSHQLQRVDAVRFFILYHYGGVYADMDINSLHSLDPLLSRYSCIIPRERYEQTWFLWGRKESLMNALMASSPRHPFMKFLMLNLHTKSHPSFRLTVKRWFGDTEYILASTGPLALTPLFYRYRPCMQPVPGTGGASACDVYVAEPYELLPTIKAGSLKNIQDYCQAWYMAGLRWFSPWKRRACEELEKNNYANKIPPEAYTDHLFSNIGYGNLDKSLNEFKDIQSLVGNYGRYKKPNNSE